MNNSHLIKINDISAGWIMGEITDGIETLYFRNSYISNFPDDFMLALLTAIGKYPDDERKNKFRAECEPVNCEWELSVSGEENLNIVVTSYENIHTDKIIGKKELKLDKNAFLRDFVAEMQEVLSEMGLYGYRLEWGHEFPLSLFVRLRNSLEDGEKISALSIGFDD